MDILAQYLCTQIPIPPRDFTSPGQMIVIRSFDVNKPGHKIEELQGGVAGGSIVKGVLKVGDEIEIRPGRITKHAGKTEVSPLFSKILYMKSETNPLQYAVPGGLIGVGTLLDPTLTRADHLVGNVLGMKGRLPNTYVDLEVKFFLLKRLLGVKSKEGDAAKVKKLATNEMLMVNIGSTAVGGRIVGLKPDQAKIELTQPVCTQVGDKVALSRRIEKHWRLIGWGEIIKGTKFKLEGEKEK